MFFKKDEYSIIADVGGTKTRIAIVDCKGSILFEKQYASSDIKHFTDTLLEFMRMPECRKHKAKDACIAVAGMIDADRKYARLTNQNWTIDTQSILVRTPLHNVSILNDFEAIGFSVDILKPGQYVELTEIGRNPAGTIAVIGAGTGLGVSIVPLIRDKHIPILSEGGHVDFPARCTDPIDVKLQVYLIKMKKYHDTEDMVSGRGIINVYEFLKSQKVRHNNAIRLAISKASADEKPALITKYALEDKDVLCIRTLELFIRYYARVSRNLAITSLCSEIIIAGGIAPKILPALQDAFIEEFVNHDMPIMRKYLERIPILVITDPNLAIYGASNALKIKA